MVPWLFSHYNGNPYMWEKSLILKQGPEFYSQWIHLKPTQVLMECKVYWIKCIRELPLSWLMKIKRLSKTSLIGQSLRLLKLTLECNSFNPVNFYHLTILYLGSVFKNHVGLGNWKFKYCRKFSGNHEHIFFCIRITHIVWMTVSVIELP